MTAAVHVIISTHTTRHLRATLWGLARQTRPAATLTVSCDNDLPEIGAVVRAAVSDFQFAPSTIVHWVRRPHQGVARLDQVRNNGIRTALAAGASSGRFLILDGDILTSPDTIAKHAQFANLGLVGTSRILTDEARTAELTAAVDRPDSRPPLPTAPELATLDREQRNAEWHLALRRASLGPLRFTKSHKPKIIGAHFSVSVDLVQRINGFDEEYEGYGMDDDDFGRRCYQAGAHAAVAITAIPVFHLFHPTRMQGRWQDQPGHARFSRRDLPFRTVRGLENPIPQPPPIVDTMR